MQILHNQLDRKFSYDPLNRLLSATGRESSSSVESDLWNDYTPKTGAVTASACQAYTRNYEYDKMGNIEKLIQTGTSGFTRNFTYNDSGSNILHAVKNADESTTHASFTYDVNGNRLTSGSAKHYVWDYADQLKCFHNQTGTGQPNTYAQYLYSGGQRVKKLVRSFGGATETTVYIDGIMEFRADSSAHTQSVVHIGGVATIRTGYAFDGMASITYELSNHLGSSSYRLSGTGSLIDREEYYPFGDTSLRTWEKKRYRYVGKEKDQESGLYYYGARYYAAWTCRFISTDPLAWEYAQLNSYNYAGNKPINHLDIDGMQSNEDDKSENNQTNQLVIESYIDNGSIEVNLESGTYNSNGTFDPDTGTHIVEAGNILSLIKDRYGVTLDQILTVNEGITNPDEIKVGQKIIIPKSVKVWNIAPEPEPLFANMGTCVNDSNRPYHYIGPIQSGDSLTFNSPNFNIQYPTFGFNHSSVFWDWITFLETDFEWKKLTGYGGGPCYLFTGIVTPQTESLEWMEPENAPFSSGQMGVSGQYNYRPASAKIDIAVDETSGGDFRYKGTTASINGRPEKTFSKPGASTEIYMKFKVRGFSESDAPVSGWVGYQYGLLGVKFDSNGYLKVSLGVSSSKGLNAGTNTTIIKTK